MYEAGGGGARKKDGQTHLKWEQPGRGEIRNFYGVENGNSRTAKCAKGAKGKPGSRGSHFDRMSLLQNS